MLENIMAARTPIGNRASSTTLLVDYTHLSGTMWYWGGRYYQYGGKTTSYTDDNTFRRFFETTPRTFETLSVTAADGNTVACGCPNSVVIGNEVYLVGRHTSSVICVVVLDLTTLQRRTYVNTGGFAHNGGPNTAVAYDGTDKIYIKSENASFVVAFSKSTKTFSNVITGLAANPTSAGAIAYKSGYLYMMGGYTSSYVTAVSRVKISDGTINTTWDTLGANFVSVWQGPRSVNGVFRYCTWANGLNGVISYCVYDPETKKQVSRIYSTPLTYRNATFQQIIPGGVIYGGGTSIALGAANWQTQGRTNGAFLISDPDITGYY